MKNKVWNYCPDDVNIIRMSIVYNEKGEAVAVKKDDNGVPLIFDDLSFWGFVPDEFHPFAILWDDDEPLAICYSLNAAYKMHLTLLIHYEIDASISTIPYDNPQRFGDDEHSRYLREDLYMDEYLASRGLNQEDIVKVCTSNEFKEFVRIKDAELKKLVEKSK